MKKFALPYLVLAAGLFTLPAFSQNNEDSLNLLGLPGDNLDLYAVLTLFQKSKTIESFEKDLNLKETGVNNLDLDLDKKVDFIKVSTKMEKDSSYTFTLQVDVAKNETQDVASILLDKDKKGKISLQIVGAEALYGKDYVVEPKGNSPVTPNPAYTGTDPVTVTVPATTTVVVVEQAPIVQYVYSPAYVPYYPPYYYGYYPAYHLAFTAIAIGIYHNNCWGYHGGYHGGHYGGGNTVIINNGNRNNINHNNSNIVNNNRNNGKYGNGSANRGQGNRNTAGTRPSTSNNKAGAGNRPSTGNASTRPSTSQGKVGSSSANRPSTSNYNRPSSNGASRSMSSGGRTMSSGGGMSRGGGGGGGRRR